MLASVVLVAAGNEVLVGWVGGVCLVFLPLAIGAAVLCYRLFDLDRIISRTLSYGLLTVLLGGGYAGVVLGLGQLFGRDSSLVVAGATLTVAAVFLPARRRVQQLVDQRFNRRRYDAAQTIAAFSVRLRQQVDLEALTAELLAVVEQTMQPTQVSLWLRSSVTASQDQSRTGASRAAPAVRRRSASVPAPLLWTAGADVVAIDQEHGPIGPESLHAMVASTAGSLCSPWVRVPGCDEAAVKTALDVGAEGIVFPLVTTAESAAECDQVPAQGEAGMGSFRRALPMGCGPV